MLQHTSELGIQRRIDGQCSLLDRVHKPQSPRVQQQSMHAEVLFEEPGVLGTTITCVSDQRVTQVREMPTNLPVAAGSEFIPLVAGAVSLYC